MDKILYFDKGNVKICKNFKDRLSGMMFKKKKDNLIYFFPKCNSIHTFFMFKNIDVIMTDKDDNIIKIYINLKPFRIILPQKNIKNVYEMDCNLIKNIDSYNKVKI